MKVSLTAIATLTASPNNTELRGQRASRTVVFGEFSRYCLFAVHVREGNRVMWMVEDAETVDPETGLSEVIRQAWTPFEAVKGLEAEFATA